MGSEKQAVEAASTSTSDKRLAELSVHRNKAVRAAVARNLATPTDVLEGLTRDKHHLPRYGVAENPDPRAWRVALGASDPGVRVILAQRQDLDEQTVATLLADPDREVRRSLATSSRRPHVVAASARDNSPQVRSRAGLNPALTRDDLELLAKDSDPNVRATAAQSRRLSEDTVQRLVRDRSYMTRHELLWARPERVDIAEALQHDKVPIVADLARDCLAPPTWMQERLAELAAFGRMSS